MTPRQRPRRGDDGVALVMALVFMLVVSLFALVALRKSETTVLSGQRVRERGQLQYALDGGVERAVQLLRSELVAGAPPNCVAPAAATVFTVEPGGLDLNGHRVDYSCETLAGRAVLTGDTTVTNYAILVTSPDAGALTTQSGSSDALRVDGSVYLNGKVTNGNLLKEVALRSGDLVSPLSRAGCAADLAALTDVGLTGTGQLRACTEQAVADAIPTVTLPPAPAFDVSAVLRAGVQVNLPGGAKCQVYLPGRYTAPPLLGKGAHYFVSGLYYFHNTGTWTVDGDDEVLAGTKGVSTDVSVGTKAGCAAITDELALANPAVAAVAASIPASTFFTSGATWVFGGTSQLAVKRGAVTMFTPPGLPTEPAVNLVAATPTTGGGYAAVATGHEVLTGGTNNTRLRFNAKVLAPTAHVDLFSTNDTVAAAAGGVVAYTLHLQASASGGEGLAISAPGGSSVPPPPFRTLRVVARERGGASAATNTAVLTIGNFGTHAVDVLSWRTG